MLWWKEIADLKRRLKIAESDLEKEQGKAQRLVGFLSRLQRFGVSPTGQVPRREFAEALLDSISMLLKTEQAVLFEKDPASFDLLPAAARGVSPDVLSRLRVRMGESLLGRAAQSMKPVVQNTSEAKDESFFAAPYLLFPLLSEARCIGLVLIARPLEGSFTPESRELASLFAGQAALTLSDHLRHAELEERGDHIVAGLGRALEAKDTYTHSHSSRMRDLVRPLAQEIPLPESLIREMEYGAYLHDLGKMGIPEAILTNPGKLTAQEYTEIKKHPAIGHRILQSIPSLRQSAAIVLYHHEWYNGTGYPEGLAGEEIPLGARIVQIIDAWDAMTSDRPYRQAMPKAAAMAELRRQEGTQFDPKFVEIFLRVIARLEREGVSTTEQSAEKPLAARPA